MSHKCRLCGNELYCSRCIYCSFECTYDIPANNEEIRIILPDPKNVYKKIHKEIMYVKKR